ncbi:molybdopterin-guanine dinucleotide biosynthesis protein B [Ammoniphilus sp. CFH 90114]|uniref:molybdopterin-guanine dinucleotide biosynthesis protein B n=1 Tax=Ammoniphilus sp. CFH 90114 TaxID=2493665 RepID=UPI00100E438A|nr:molybdopterin-guanine dinucleotide biosynthesis protein B [Ammoniphilus sp. CFH 90114]RXT05839.1 molybdopterin-guanine dinucleotide biosynthesis protein B [Ammoniphilus sp. CFH 90114]
MTEKAVIQIVGYKNSGKTTTSCEMIRRFSELGWKVGSIKHDAHDFEVDYPGKDTWLHREAGAQIVAISSKDKTAIMEQQSSSLDDLLTRMSGVDLVIVEGYKFESYPKVVLLRNEGDLPLLDQANEIIAVSTWFPYQHPILPVVEKDQYEQLFQIISDFLKN